MKELQLLGSRMKDRITGFKGVVTCISFDVAGCVLALLTPEAQKGKLGEREWFDIIRLEKAGAAAMPVPLFERVAGGQDLPTIRSGPGR